MSKHCECKSISMRVVKKINEHKKIAKNQKKLASNIM